MVFRRRLIERTWGQPDVVVYDGTFGFRVCGLCSGDQIEVYGYDGLLVNRISVSKDGCMEVDIPEDPQPFDFYDNIQAYVAFKGIARPEDWCSVTGRYHLATVPHTYFGLFNASYARYDSTGAMIQQFSGQVQLADPGIFMYQNTVYYEAEIAVRPPSCGTRMRVQIPAQDQIKFVYRNMTGINRWAVVKVVGPNGAEKGNMRVWAGTLIRHRY